MQLAVNLVLSFRILSEGASVGIKQRILESAPTWSQQLIHLRHRQGWIDLLSDLQSDHLSKTGQVSCSTNLIFVAGLPKAGTTWLEQLLSHTPGMVQLNKSCLRAYPHFISLPHCHDVAPEMLTCAPENKLSFLKLHLNPHPHNFNILDDLNIRTVILIRDLRDVLISRYHHVMSQPSHWDYQRLTKLPERTRLLASMQGIRPDNAETAIHYYQSWISGWLKCAELAPQNSLVIRYEEIKANTGDTLRKIYDFYGYCITDKAINEVISKQKEQTHKSQSQHLRKKLKQTGRAISTFRKGNVGEWHQCFDEALKQFVKQSAGQTLIEAGYEKDLNW